METPFLYLAQLCNELEKIKSINEKVLLISKFLSTLNENEVEPAVLLIIGTIFAQTDPKTLDISWKSLSKVRDTSKQTTLLQHSLTVRAVHSYFSTLAEISGPNSRKKKRRILETLFREGSSIERKFITRNVMGEMRHGIAEGVMLKAIAKASQVDITYLKKINAISGNIGNLATVAINNGLEGLKNIKISPFQPIKPMLADPIDTIDELPITSNQKVAVEYKYDGIRVQIHKYKDTIKIFSRQLKEITSSFPEIKETLSKSLSNEFIILDGEIIAISSTDGRPLPFQELMRRSRRIHDINKLQREIPIQLILFDILLLDYEVLFDIPYEYRRNILRSTCKKMSLASRILTSNKTEINQFYQQALNAGHEGIVIKYLDSPYSPGYRKKAWLKLKDAIYLDLVIIAADWGSGRRVGWLSNYHLAVRDPETNTYHEIGKTFKGLTDAEFKAITATLQDLKTQETDYTVYVKPQIIVEVAFNEIQKSPQYPSGYALRFARIKRIRSDKSISEITTLQEIAELYDSQFEKKASL